MKRTTCLALLLITFSLFGNDTILIAEPDNRTDVSGTSKNWTPYYGASRISESEFYQIAGHETEAMIAMNYQKKKRAVGITNIGIAIASLAVALSPIVFEDWNTGTKVGMSLGGLSVGLLVPPIIGMSAGIDGTRYSPYSYAAATADEYNKSIGK